MRGCLHRDSGRRRSTLWLLAAALLLVSLPAVRATAECCACTGCAASGFCIDDVTNAIACSDLCTSFDCDNITCQYGETCDDGVGCTNLPTLTPTGTPFGTATATLTPTETATVAATETVTNTPEATATATVTPPVTTTATATN